MLVVGVSEFGDFFIRSGFATLTLLCGVKVRVEGGVTVMFCMGGKQQQNQSKMLKDIQDAFLVKHSSTIHVERTCKD